jgi:tetratricopeptide (TPR) repeat protein
MNYKNLLISSVVVMTALSTQVYAKELQAQVQKTTSTVPNIYSQQNVAPIKSLSQPYPEIAKLIEYNHCDEADLKIKEMLDAKPNDANLIALKAVSMAKQYKLDPAQFELDKLLKTNPNNPIAHYAQGYVYMQRQTASDVDYIKTTRGLINSAIKEFVTAVNLDKNYYQAYNAMGVATLKLGNKSDALDLFNTSLKVNSGFANAYDNVGVVEMMNGNLDAAETNFMKAMKYNTHNPTAWYHMSQVETRRGNYSKALTWVNHSLHVNPNSSPALTLQGELYLKQGNQSAAINSFKKAQLVKPENIRPYLNLATIYENRGDEEFAMEQLKTALAISPNNSESKLRIANLALHIRKYDQALDYYTKLVGDATYNDDAIIGLANTYYEMSKDKGENNGITTNREVYLAYDYINKAIEKCPEDLELHLAKLKLARLVHQDPFTQDSLNYIVQSAGNSLMDNVIKGEAYLALGREKDAVYTFENAVNFSDSVEDDLYLGEILVHNKQFRTARIALQKALMQDPDNIIAKNGIDYINLCEVKSNEFFDIAQRQYQENNYASAIEYCNRAIDFYHNSPQIAKLKAMSYEKELNYRGAVKYYQQYLAMSPDAADREAIQQKINNYAPKSN